MYGAPWRSSTSHRHPVGEDDGYEDIDFQATQRSHDFDTVTSLDSSVDQPPPKLYAYYRTPIVAPTVDSIRDPPAVGATGRNVFLSREVATPPPPTDQTEWRRLMQAPPMCTPPSDHVAPPIQTPHREGRFHDRQQALWSGEPIEKSLLHAVPSMFPPMGTAVQRTSEPRLSAEAEANMWQRRFGSNVGSYMTNNDDRFLDAFAAPPSPPPPHILTPRHVNTIPASSGSPVQFHLVETPPRKPFQLEPHFHLRHAPPMMTPPHPQTRSHRHNHPTQPTTAMTELLHYESLERQETQSALLETLVHVQIAFVKHLEELELSHKPAPPISTPLRSILAPRRPSPLSRPHLRQHVIFDTTQKAVRAQIHSEQTEQFIQILMMFRNNKPPHTTQNSRTAASRHKTKARLPQTNKPTTTDAHLEETQPTPALLFNERASPTAHSSPPTYQTLTTLLQPTLETNEEERARRGIVAAMASAEDDLLQSLGARAAKADLEARENRARNDEADEEERARRGIVAAMVSAEDDLLRSRGARAAKADLEARESARRSSIVSEAAAKLSLKHLRKLSKVILKESLDRGVLKHKELVAWGRLYDARVLSQSQSPLSGIEGLLEVVSAQSFGEWTSSVMGSRNDLHSEVADRPREPTSKSDLRGTRPMSPRGEAAVKNQSRREAVLGFFHSFSRGSSKLGVDELPRSENFAEARRTMEMEEKGARLQEESHERNLWKVFEEDFLLAIPLDHDASLSKALRRGSRSSSAGRQHYYLPYDPNRDIILGSRGHPRGPEERDSRNPSRSPSFANTSVQSPPLRSRNGPTVDEDEEDVAMGESIDTSILDVSSIAGSQSNSFRFLPRGGVNTVPQIIIQSAAPSSSSPIPPHSFSFLQQRPQHHLMTRNESNLSVSSAFSPRRASSVASAASTMTADIPCPWSYGLKLSDGSGPLTAAGDLGSRRGSTVGPNQPPSKISRRDYLCLRVVESKPPGFPSLCKGDVVVAVEGSPVASLRAVRRLLGESQSGRVTLTVIRGSTGVTETVTIQGEPK